MHAPIHAACAEFSRRIPKYSDKLSREWGSDLLDKKMALVRCTPNLEFQNYVTQSNRNFLAKW